MNHSPQGPSAPENPSYKPDFEGLMAAIEALDSKENKTRVQRAFGKLQQKIEGESDPEKQRAYFEGFVKKATDKLGLNYTPPASSAAAANPLDPVTPSASPVAPEVQAAPAQSKGPDTLIDTSTATSEGGINPYGAITNELDRAEQLIAAGNHAEAETSLRQLLTNIRENTQLQGRDEIAQAVKKAETLLQQLAAPEAEAEPVLPTRARRIRIKVRHLLGGLVVLGASMFGAYHLGKFFQQSPTTGQQAPAGTGENGGNGEGDGKAGEGAADRDGVEPSTAPVSSSATTQTPQGPDSGPVTNPTTGEEPTPRPTPPETSVSADLPEEIQRFQSQLEQAITAGDQSLEQRLESLRALETNLEQRAAEEPLMQPVLKSCQDAIQSFETRRDLERFAAELVRCEALADQSEKLAALAALRTTVQQAAQDNPALVAMQERVTASHQRALNLQQSTQRRAQARSQQEQALQAAQAEGKEPAERQRELQALLATMNAEGAVSFDDLRAQAERALRLVGYEVRLRQAVALQGEEQVNHLEQLQSDLQGDPDQPAVAGFQEQTARLLIESRNTLFAARYQSALETTSTVDQIQELLELKGLIEQQQPMDPYHEIGNAVNNALQQAQQRLQFSQQLATARAEADPSQKAQLFRQLMQSLEEAMYSGNSDAALQRLRQEAQQDFLQNQNARFQAALSITDLESRRQALQQLSQEPAPSVEGMDAWTTRVTTALQDITALQGFSSRFETAAAQENAQERFQALQALLREIQQSGQSSESFQNLARQVREAARQSLRDHYSTQLSAVADRPLSQRHAAYHALERELNSIAQRDESFADLAQRAHIETRTAYYQHASTLATAMDDADRLERLLQLQTQAIEENSDGSLDGVVAQFPSLVQAAYAQVFTAQRLEINQEADLQTRVEGLRELRNRVQAQGEIHHQPLLEAIDQDIASAETASFGQRLQHIQTIDDADQQYSAINELIQRMESAGINPPAEQRQAAYQLRITINTSRLTNLRRQQERLRNGVRSLRATHREWTDLDPDTAAHNHPDTGQRMTPDQLRAMRTTQLQRHQRLIDQRSASLQEATNAAATAQTQIIQDRIATMTAQQRTEAYQSAVAEVTRLETLERTFNASLAEWLEARRNPQHRSQRDEIEAEITRLRGLIINNERERAAAVELRDALKPARQRRRVD